VAAAWAENMQARFSKGTFAKIDAVLRESEERTQFVREAVEREIERRRAQREATGTGGE
jgi:metal-responsive CopG/Arc/MetJ family transcriptional regulator